MNKYSRYISEAAVLEHLNFISLLDSSFIVRTRTTLSFGL
jgi:hypothetical protein